ncbi:MAG: hypothetical protein R6U84_04520 [Candidatus Cloacimonadales bacterium]
MIRNSIVIAILVLMNNVNAFELIEEEINNNFEHVEAVFEEADTGELILYFAEENGLVQVTPENRKPYSVPSYKRGFQFANDHRIYLDEFERFLCFNENIILTINTNLNEERKEIRKYSLSNYTLKLDKTLEIDYLSEWIATQNTPNHFIVTDYSELWGTYIKIYSSNLNLIATYKPFESGFRRIHISSDSENFVMLFEAETKQADNNVSKLLVYDIYEKRIRNEAVLTKAYVNESIRGLLYSDDLIIIQSAENELNDHFLRCFNISGNSIWKRKFPSFSCLNISKKGVLIYEHGVQLKSIDIYTGEEVWKLPVNRLNSYSDGSYMYPASLHNIHNEYFLILFKLEANNNSSKTILYIIDSDGRVKEEIDFGSVTDKAEVFVNEGKCVVNIDDIGHIYDIKN